MEKLKLRDLRPIHPIPMQWDVVVVKNMVFRIIPLHELKDLSERPHADFAPKFTVFGKVFCIGKGTKSSQNDQTLAPKKIAQQLHIEIPDVISRRIRL